MSFFSRSSQPAAAPAPIESEALAPNALVSLRNIEKSLFEIVRHADFILRTRGRDLDDGRHLLRLEPRLRGGLLQRGLIGLRRGLRRCRRGLSCRRLSPCGLRR